MSMFPGLDGQLAAILAAVGAEKKARETDTNHLNRRLTIMDATIQATLDRITTLQSREDSWAAAMDLITKTNADQAARIADLQSKLDAGTDVTAADLTALAQGNVTLDEVIAKLPAAAAANTPPDAPPAAPDA